MRTKQLSVFLENKTGRLNDVTKILASVSINMTAFSVADNSDFGILRMLVSDNAAARDILKQNGFAVIITDVLAVHIGNKPGTLFAILDLLSHADIYIEYMYAFSEGETASVVIRPDNLEKAIQLLELNNIL